MAEDTDKQSENSEQPEQDAKEDQEDAETEDEGGDGGDARARQWASVVWKEKRMWLRQKFRNKSASP